MGRILIGVAAAICLAWNVTSAQEVGQKADEPPDEPGAKEAAPRQAGTEPAGRSRRESPPEQRTQMPWWQSEPAAWWQSEPAGRARPQDRQAGPRKRAVVRLKSASAHGVAETISELLDGERRAASLPAEHSAVIVPEPVNNCLLVSAAPEEIERIEELIESLDRPQPKVLIQMLIAQTTLSAKREEGPPKPSPTRTEDSRPRQITGLPERSHFSADRLRRGVEMGVLDSFPEKRGEFLRALRGPGSTPPTGASGKSGLDEQLRELRKRGPLEVLSRPQLLTLNNTQASLHVGNREPVVRSSRPGPTGPMQQVEYVDVGLQLQVTPRIAPDGQVTMEITLELSQLGPTEDGDAVSASQPVHGSRVVITETQSTVSVADGHTVVLGGLMTDSDARQEELLIILTAHVVD